MDLGPVRRDLKYKLRDENVLQHGGAVAMERNKWIKEILKW